MQFEYINKDISWFSFNERVLDEAANCSLSVSERLRFLAIFSNNFDELFHFRVRPYIKKDKEIADKIFELVNAQQKRYISLIDKSLFIDLRNEGISFIDSFDYRQSAIVDEYFKRYVFPHIQFVIMKKSILKDYPLLDNTIYLMLKFSMREDSKEKFALLSIPKNNISRFVDLDNNTFAFIEDVIRHNISIFFPSCCVYKAYSIKVLRHLDIKTKGDGDIYELINNGIEKRKNAKFSAVIYDREMPSDYLEKLISSFKLPKQMIIPSGKYLKMSDFFSFRDKFLEKSISGNELQHPLFEAGPSIRKVLKKTDVLLHYPYHTFDYLVRMLQEAIIDKRVEEISITWYRVAYNSVIYNLLTAAARNKKRVRVVVELKAKMEEERNLSFANEMRECGVEVVITPPYMKVHSKMLLIKRVNKRQEQMSYAYLCTGNFNEKTAKVYTDHVLMTSDVNICSELSILFDEIQKGLISYPFKYILVSPVNLKSSIISKLQREINNAKCGRPAFFTAKMNGLTDHEIVDLLYEASIAGVVIKLMVRGMCCLLADKEYSKNITLVRIVDQYLEHGRIYYFHNNGYPELFMGSADLMPKKLEKRVELVFPVINESLKQELVDIIEILFSDNVKLSNISILPSQKSGIRPVDSRAQEEIYKYLMRD